MSVNSVSNYNNILIRQLEIRTMENRHNAEVIQAKRTKEVQDDTELKRVEMNRRMNRPGQNVDRMA
jgi:hypothetical protein